MHNLNYCTIRSVLRGLTHVFVFALNTFDATSPIVADAFTFSAVHSDVSYAAPDSGYTWTETDMPEVTGKSGHHRLLTQKAARA